MTIRIAPEQALEQLENNRRKTKVKIKKSKF